MLMGYCSPKVVGLMLIWPTWRGKNLLRISSQNDRVLELMDRTSPSSPAWPKPLRCLLHELTTNAAKYGALSKINGHIEIRWLRLSDDRLRLTWSEAGGPVITPPSPPWSSGRM